MQYSEFGKFLRRKRESLHPEVSLNNFALENGIEPAALSRIERQKQGIILERLEQIANGYGVFISELLSEYEQTLTIKKRS